MSHLQASAVTTRVAKKYGYHLGWPVNVQDAAA